MLIKPALINRTRTRPLQWRDVAHGAWLCQQERLALAPFWPSIAGDYALQLGPLSDAVSTGCKATELVTVHAGAQARVKAELNALPFSRRSVDVVVMAHVLEYAKDPHQVLREADRALGFDGYMVVTAYNPWSLATLVGALPGQAGKAPWTGRYFTKGRVMDWLSLLNYEVLAEGYIGNSSLWPMPTERSVNAKDNPLCRSLPWLRCGYFIVARKRVFPLTPSPGFIRFARAVRTPQPAQARHTQRVDKD
ncbi:MAG: methyltransferase domain-containing protein [Idiomarina sp.]|nr:methyltransferase domain-containing protein [Idiomarina sp.]